MLNDSAAVPASESDPGPSLEACLEAILLVVDEPVAEVVLAQVLERPRDEVARALRDLAASYDEQRRGYDLRQVAGGWRFYTREECAPVVERFVRDGQEVRLTQAALETLAVVAYRQPVSRSRVSAVRGVNCDAVMRTLTLRGLVEEAGTEHETGAILYRTTGYFLERLGLASLDELPELAPFLPDHIEEAADQAGEAPDHIEAAADQAGEAPDQAGVTADQAGEPSEQTEEARDPRDDQGS
jgi:segregation and condensation protein B